MNFTEMNEYVKHQLLFMLNGQIGKKRLDVLLVSGRKDAKNIVLKEIMQLKRDILNVLANKCNRYELGTVQHKVTSYLHSSFLLDTLPEFNVIFKKYGLVLKGDL